MLKRDNHHLPVRFPIHLATFSFMQHILAEESICDDYNESFLVPIYFPGFSRLSSTRAACFALGDFFLAQCYLCYLQVNGYVLERTPRRAASLTSTASGLLSQWHFKAEAGRDLWVKEHFASAYTAVTAPSVSSVWASCTGLFTAEMRIYVPERTPSEGQRAELLFQNHGLNYSLKAYRNHSVFYCKGINKSVFCQRK